MSRPAYRKNDLRCPSCNRHPMLCGCSFISPYPDGLPGHAKDEASTAAAVFILDHCNDLQRRVYEFVKSRGERGATVFEAMEAFDLGKDTTAPRFTELGKLGAIWKTGEYRSSPSGCRANVWRARQ